MKKHLILLLVLSCPLFLFSQNGWEESGDVTSTSKLVGIGTQTPKSQLHVVGNMVLGLNQNNKKFIFHPRTNGNGDFLHITNDNGSGNWDWSQGIILRRGGNVSIGTYGHDSKLTVAGSVKIVDGTQGTGKVLTSDANGKASWQEPTSQPSLALGETHAGGIIFYLDETGEHGLVVTANDVSESATWSNGAAQITNALSKGIYGGFTNTMLIVAQQTSDNPSGTFAAQSCVNLSIRNEDGVEYGDWYLPSTIEWNLLSNPTVLPLVGIAPGTMYWSSTEANESDAYQMWVGEGWDFSDKTTTNRVRAVRKF